MAQNTIRENKIFPIYNEDGTSFHNLVLRSATVDTIVMSLGDKIYGDLRYQNNNLQFTMKEYIELDGVKYYMVSPPTTVREGLVSDNSSERGMTKYSFEFYHPMIMLSNLPFTDIAVTDEQGKYLSQNNVFSWIGKPADLVAKINKNLDGTVWCVRLNERFPEDKLNELSEVLPFSKVMISDVIKKFYEIWDVPFVVYKLPTTDPDYANGKEFVVEFGLPVSEILVNGDVFEFKFGQGVGLKNNSRTPRKNKIVTRISGAGSKNNIPYGYPQIQWYGDPNAEFTYGDHDGVYENVTIGEGGNAHTFAKLVSYPLYVGIVGGKPVKLIKHPFTREQLMPSIYSETVFNKISPYAKRVVPEVRQQTTFQEALESVSEASDNWYNQGKENFSHGLSEEFTDALNEVASKTTSDTVWIDTQNGYGYVQQDSYLNINAYFESRDGEAGAEFELQDVYNDTHNEPASPNLDYNPDTEIINFYDAVEGDPDYQYKNLIIPTQPSYEAHDFDDIKPQFGSNRLIGVTPYSKESDSAITYQQLIENINNYKNKPETTAFEKEKLNDLLEVLNMNIMSYNSKSVFEGTTILINVKTIDNQHVSVSFEDSNPNMTFYYYAQSKNYVEPEVTWDDSMDDNGKYNQSFFKITLPQLTFDIYASASITEEMSINMRSGACIGCTFKVDVDWDDYKRNFYDVNGNFAPDGEQRDLDKYPKSNEQQITVIVQKDLDTFGTLMPNTYQQPKGETSEGSDDGDEFVVLGISMPQEYITSAESELDAAMKAFMLENNNHYFDYPLKFDEFFLTQNKNILNQIKPNSIIRFNYAGEHLELYVKQMTVKYGDKPLPQYDITLTDDIDVVKNEIGATIDKVEKTSYLVSLLSQNYNKAGQQGVDSKLSKVENDVAQGVIGFLNGLWVNKNGVYGFDRDGNIVANNITAQNILLESISAKNNHIQIDATDVSIGRETAVGLSEGNISIYGTYKTYGARVYGGTPYSEYSINSIKFYDIYNDFEQEGTIEVTTLIRQVLSGDYAGRISINGSPVALISDINVFATQSWVQSQGYVSQDWATANLITKHGNQNGIWGYKRFTASESGVIPAFGNRTVEIANTGITFVVAPSLTQQQPPTYILTGGDEGLTINNGTTTEVIATRDWVGQQGYTTNNGTVTSVAMTVPTGFSVSGTPITTSGTFAITFASGYSLPTTAKQTQWDTAYSRSHTHSNKSVLDGITSTKVSNWDTAYGWGNHANAGYAHTSQLSSYLPKTGGTLQDTTETPLTIQTGITNGTSAYIIFADINGNAIGKFGFSSGTPQVIIGNTTYTVYHAGNLVAATQSAAGLMSAADKIKLDGLSNYSLPLAANGTRGGIQIGYTESGKYYAVKLSSEKAYVYVPWTDTWVAADSTHDGYVPKGVANKILRTNANGALYWGDELDPSVAVTSVVGLTGDVTSAQIGSALTTAGYKLTDTDTKNTAGAANNAGVKLFLVGATAQTANPQTYSNINVYIGTDNCLYSNGAKVVTGSVVTSVVGQTGAVTATQIGSALTNAGYKLTWRGIQDNLTSTSTTDSLSANQGRLLANGDARDSTKLPLGGGTLTGAVAVSAVGTPVYIEIGAGYITFEPPIGDSATLTNINGRLNVGTEQLAYTSEIPAVPSWALASSKPSYTLDEVADGTTRKLSNYATVSSVTTLQGYFTNGIANNADKLDGQHGSYYAKASDVTTLQGYFTNGVANAAAYTKSMDDYSFTADSLPKSFALGISAGFVNSNAGYGSYGSVLTVRTFNSGGGTLQLYAPYSSTYGGTRLKARFGNYAVSSGNSWTELKEIAWLSDVPTNTNQLTNGAGFITSSGSCAYATNAGDSEKLGGNSPSDFMSVSAAQNNITGAKTWMAGAVTNGNVSVSISGSGITLSYGNSTHNPPISRGYTLKAGASGLMIGDSNIITSATIGSQSVSYATTAGSVDTLTNSRTLWGQSFDGSANVSGAMSGVTNVDSLLYFDTTNSRVGIGTSIPAYTLDINGTLNASGTITQNGVSVLTKDGGQLKPLSTLTFVDDASTVLQQKSLIISYSGITVPNDSVILGAKGNVFASDGSRVSYGNNSTNIPYSNGTVCTNLNADMLDGKHASNFVEIISGAISGISSIDSLLNFDTTNSKVYMSGTNTKVSMNGSCLEVAKTLTDSTLVEHDGLSYHIYGDALIKRLKFDATDNYKLKIETEISGVTTTSEIITSDTIGSQSVASAATLTTSRTIWGQSFNGSGNITGNLSNVNNITPSVDNEYVIGDTNKRYAAIYARALVAYGTSSACHVGTSSTNRLSLHWSSGNERGLYHTTSSASDWLIKTDGTNTYLLLGKVGIGVTSPTQKLHANGRILADRTGYSTTMQVQLDPINVETTLIRGSNSAYFRLSTTEAVYNTTLGGHHFKQAITCDSSVTATSHPTSSDERLKNIQDYFGEISIKDIAQAPTIRYTWNNGSDRLLHRGTIAQYWKKVTPECVVEDMDGYLAMQYDVIALLAAISLARKMQNHENRIQQLEEENKKLRELINNISNN